MKPRGDIGGSSIRRAARKARRGPVSVAPEIQRSALPKRQAPAPARRVGVFTQPLPKGPAFQRQQQHTATKTQRADRAVGGRETRLPVFPKLKRYTPEQRRTIIRETTKSLAQIAHQDHVPHTEVADHVMQQAKDVGDKNALQTLRQFRAAYAKDMAPIARARGAHGRAFEVLPLAQKLRLGTSEASPGPAKTKPKRAEVKVAGISIPIAGNIAGLLALGGAAAVNTDRAIIEDPSGVAKSSIRSGVESITGLPQAAKMIAEDPRHAFSAIAQDYERRYGPIVEGDWETFRERLKTDYGVTPYMLDAAAVVGGGGAVAGVAAKSTAAGRLAARLAESPEPLSRGFGKALGAAHRTMHEERPNLRISGGPTGVKPQDTSRNLVVAAGQKILDRARLAKSEKARGVATRQQAEIAGEAPVGSTQFTGHAIWRNADHDAPVTVTGHAGTHGGREYMHVEGSSTAVPLDELVKPREAGTRALHTSEGRVSGLEAERQPGEVLPHYSLRETPLLHRYMGRTERMHGSRKSSERLRLLQEGGALEKQARGLINTLDKREQDALIYSMQFGVRAHRLDDAVAALKSYRRKIVLERKKRGTVIGKSEPDELPTLDRIIANPERYITPNLDEVANGLRELEHQAAAKDPGLVAEQAKSRRLLPQSILLGDAARRAPDVEAFHGRLQSLEQKLRDQGVEPGNLVERFGGLADVAPEHRAAVAGELERELRKLKKAAGRQVETARRGAARRKGAIDERAARGRPIRTADVRATEQAVTDMQAEVSRLEKKLRTAERKAGRAHGRAERDVAAGDRQSARAAAAHEDAVRQARIDFEERDHLAAYHRERARIERDSGDAKAAKQHEDTAAHYERVAEKYKTKLDRLVGNAPAGKHVPLERLLKTEGDSLGLELQLQRANAGLDQARSDLEHQLSIAPRVSVKAQQTLDRAYNRVLEARAARDDIEIEHAIAAHLKGELKTRPGSYESTADFERRVNAAAVEAGLDAPSYFESSGGHELRRSLKAIGTGVRGAATDKAYTGARLLTGTQAHDPEIVIAGLLRNAKRRFSWRFTLTTVQQAAFDWSRGPAHGGLTAAEMARELDRRGIDPTSVAYVNVRVLENRQLHADELAVSAAGVPGVDPEDLHALQAGLADASIDAPRLLAEAEDVTNADVRGQAFNRYLAMPKRDYDELAAATKPDGAVGRSIDILWKQKPARILLGLANTAWLGFQMLANGFVAGLGGTLNPFDYLAAQRWWRSLTPEEKLAIEPELGITHSHHHAGDQTHLGAAVNNRLVNGWHAFKKATTEREVRVPGTAKSGSLHDLNPLDAMFRVDEAQNNFFRRAVLYNKVKRDAYARMGANWTSIQGVQQKALSVLSLKRPEEKMRAIINHRDDFERHAKHVKDFLGDYLTFSSRERAVISRSVMFYGYLRYSLRFTFWTMPVEHPVTTAIMSELGRMGAQEVKRLLGVPPDAPDDNYRSTAVPAQMLAQMYFGSAADLKAEKPGAGTINVGRMNPFMNTLTQIERPEQALGLFSPLFLAEVDQLEQRSSFAGRTWRIGGTPTPAESERASDYFGSFWGQLHPSIPNPAHLAGIGPAYLTKGVPRGRILERQLLELANPFRMWEDASMPGSQSDDSLPWFQLPMEYKSPAAKKGTAEARKRDEETPVGTKLLRRGFPFTGPAPTAAPIALQRQLEKRGISGTAKKKKRTRKAAGFGSGGDNGFSSGSGGGGFGG